MTTDLSPRIKHAIQKDMVSLSHAMNLLSDILQLDCRNLKLKLSPQPTHETNKPVSNKKTCTMCLLFGNQHCMNRNCTLLSHDPILIA